MKNRNNINNSAFARKVLAVVRGIPKGQTMTYGEVANFAGYPGAARAVGSVMAHNYNTQVPCHRVVLASGKLGNYNRGGSETKRKLLQKEGALKN